MPRFWQKMQGACTQKMTKRLRNIFDQYTQPENHLTNSLLLVLNHNRSLLRKVLKMVKIKLSGKQVNLLSQIAPQTVKDKTSIPDGYIYTEDYGFCVGIETKIMGDALKRDQLKGHLNQLVQYDRSYLLALTPDEKPPKVVLELQKQHKSLKFLSWIELIKIMSKEGPDKGKNPVGKFVYDEFMSFMERQYEMTPFTGINFRDGYDVNLATHYVKRISKELTPEIRKAYPKCKHTRKKIGRGSGHPWESWYPKKNVQEGVHLTFVVANDEIRCVTVLANGCKKEWKNLQDTLDSEKSIAGFKKCLRKVYAKRPKGSITMVSFRQRHYPSRTVPVHDAVTELNVAMLLGMDKSKPNEVWWNLIREIARTKGKYNYQLEIGYYLPYGKNDALKTTKALQIIMRCFKNLKPVYDLLVQE